MKFMHIGDLHIGRTINQHSLLIDQKYMLDRLVEAMEQESIDALIIAGDIFDRALPSKEAVLLFERFIEQVNMALNIPVFAISGNHDGAERLGYGKSWFSKTGFHMVTSIEESFKPLYLDDIAIYLVPYIDAVDAKVFFGDETIATHGDAYIRVMEEINAQMDRSKSNILVSHLFVSGGKESDSERPLSMGTLEYVPQSIFKDVDYVALGHLHHPFAVNSDHIFYSGSILKYSFSEAAQPKGYRIVEIDKSAAQDARITTQFVPVAPLHDMAVIEASYEDAINDRLDLSDNAIYLKLILSGLNGINDPMLKLKQLYPNLLELRHIESEQQERTVDINIENQSDREIINQFVMAMTDVPLSENQIALISQVMEEQLHEAD